MKVFVHRFFSNDTTLKLEDIIQDIRVLESKELFKVTLALNTTGDDVAIYASKYIYTSKYKGQAIEIQPIIYGLEGKELYTHEKYYYIVLVFEDIDADTSSVNALDHHYEVFFIKEAELENMEPVEVEIIS